MPMLGVGIATGGYSLLCGEYQRHCATAALASRHASDERDQER